MDAPPSFAFAKDQITQVLTLSTAVIGLTVTFVKDLKAGADEAGRGFVATAWVFLLLSIGLGVMAMGTLTGTLDDARQALAQTPPPQLPTVYDPTIKLFGLLQAVFFFVGLAFLIIHAFKAASK